MIRTPSTLFPLSNRVALVVRRERELIVQFGTQRQSPDTPPHVLDFVVEESQCKPIKEAMKDILSRMKNNYSEITRLVVIFSREFQPERLEPGITWSRALRYIGDTDTHRKTKQLKIYLDGDAMPTSRLLQHEFRDGIYFAFSCFESLEAIVFSCCNFSEVGQIQRFLTRIFVFGIPRSGDTVRIEFKIYDFLTKITAEDLNIVVRPRTTICSIPPVNLIIKIAYINGIYERDEYTAKNDLLKALPDGLKEGRGIVEFETTRQPTHQGTRHSIA